MNSSHRRITSSLIFCSAIIAVSLFTPELVSSNQETTRSIFDERYRTWKTYLEQNTPLELKVRSSIPESVLYDNEPFRAIVNLGPSAVPFVLEKLNEEPSLGKALIKITKWRYHIKRMAEKTGKYVWIVEEYPEIRSHQGPPRSVDIWLHWWKQGRIEAPQRFEKLYAEWRELRASGKLKESNDKYQKILDIGIDALPYIVVKIQEGESGLVPALPYLTDNDVGATATVSQVAQWWTRNRQRWTLPVSEETATPTPFATNMDSSPR